MEAGDTAMKADVDRHTARKDLKAQWGLRIVTTELCLIRDVHALITAKTGSPPADAIYKNSLALLLAVLARPELRWQLSLPSQCVRARDYIETRLSNELSSRELARCAGMSMAGFNRAFGRYIGTSPARYVTEMWVHTPTHARETIARWHRPSRPYRQMGKKWKSTE